jgi:hypothetical protein
MAEIAAALANQLSVGLSKRADVECSDCKEVHGSEPVMATRHPGLSTPLATPSAFQNSHSVFFDPLGITIRDQIQPDVMLKQRFEARQDQRESLSRVGHLFYKFVAVASEAGLRDADEGCAVLLGCEPPFDGGGTPVSRPLDDNALVRFDRFCSD